MPIYKKINRATGAEELCYIVYEVISDEIEGDLYSYDSGYSCLAGYLTDYNIIWMITGEARRLYVMIHYNDGEGDPVMATHVEVGEILVLHDITPDCEDLWDIRHTYTPAELEALYPRDKYDTVVVGGN